MDYLSDAVHWAVGVGSLGSRSPAPDFCSEISWIWMRDDEGTIGRKLYRLVSESPATAKTVVSWFFSLYKPIQWEMVSVHSDLDAVIVIVPRPPRSINGTSQRLRTEPGLTKRPTGFESCASPSTAILFGKLPGSDLWEKGEPCNWNLSMNMRL